MRRAFTWSTLPNAWRAARYLWHLPNFVRLGWRLFRDPRVGLLPKAVLVGGIAYVVSPIDLIPGAILPLVGGLDDLAVGLIAVRLFFKLCPRAIVEEHVQRIDLEQGRSLPPL